MFFRRTAKVTTNLDSLTIKCNVRYYLSFNHIVYTTKWQFQIIYFLFGELWAKAMVMVFKILEKASGKRHQSICLAPKVSNNVLAVFLCPGGLVLSHRKSRFGELVTFTMWYITCGLGDGTACINTRRAFGDFSATTNFLPADFQTRTPTTASTVSVRSYFHCGFETICTSLTPHA